MAVSNYNNAADVTQSDSADLPNSGMLYIGTAGDGTLKVNTKGGQTIAFVGVVAGFFKGLDVERVWSTGSGVSDVVVFY